MGSCLECSGAFVKGSVLSYCTNYHHGNQSCPKKCNEMDRNQHKNKKPLLRNSSVITAANRLFAAHYFLSGMSAVSLG